MVVQAQQSTWAVRDDDADSFRSRRGLDVQRPYASTSAFVFDDLASRTSQDSSPFDQEEYEDERDQAIFAMSRHIRRGLDALSSADMYQDPNLSHDLSSEVTDEQAYSLASRLADAAVIDTPPPTQPSSSRASTVPTAPSDRSRRSSSEANDDELKTPPELLQSGQHRVLLPRLDLYNALSRYQIGDGSELEMLDDGIAQTRAAGKARELDLDTGMPWQRPRPVSMALSVSNSSTHANQPFTRLSLHDIAFKATTLAEQHRSSVEYIDLVTRKFPTLCEPPVRELGEDGQPLPPTKRQEISDVEREARKASMTATPCGKQTLSLIKAMIVLESRTASWKRIGSADLANFTTELPKLGPAPSPWAMEVRHEDLNVSLLKGKNKKTLELTSLRKHAQCPKCDGQRVCVCVTCKGEKADACFWCSGTGREKMRAKASCRRCQGAGVLKCNTCQGELKSKCQTCDGQGSGEYGFFVDVKIKRVEMPAAPISTLLPQYQHTSTPPALEEVKAAATLALWDSIVKMTEALQESSAKSSKHKAMVPVMAGCVWETSTSNIVALDVPLAAKCKKGGAAPALRPEGLQRKIATTTRYFAVPSDADVDPVELSAQEATRLSAISSSIPATPASKEFIPRPSPLSQHQVTTPATLNGPTMEQTKARRPSAGQLLAQKMLRTKLPRGSI